MLTYHLLGHRAPMALALMSRLFIMRYVVILDMTRGRVITT